MSVSYVSIGTGTDSSTASVTLPFPGGTSIASGNLAIALLAFWDTNRSTALPALNSAAVTAGWQAVGDTLGTGGGGGSFGVDTGPRDVAAYWWVSDGTGTGVGFDLDDSDNGSGCRGYVMSFSKTLGDWATPIAVAGEDSTDGTAFSVTGASDFGGAGSLNGDMLAIGVVNRPDTATQGTPTCNYASGTYTQRGSGAATAGNDGRHNCGTVPCSGTSSGAPVFTATLSANGTGSAVFVRLRDQTNATASPSAVALTTALPSASPSVGSTMAPSAIAVPLATPSATPKSGGDATPAVVAVTVSLPAATAAGSGDASVTPATITIPVVLPAPTLSGGGTATPGVISTTVALPAVTTGAGSSASPAVIPITIALPDASATGTASGTATPAVIVCTATLPAPTATGGGTATPATVPLVVTIPAASAQAPATVTPSVIPITVDAPAPTLSAGSTATPSAVAIVTATPNPGISAGAGVNPATVALAVTLAAVLASGTPPDVNPITVTVRDLNHTVTATTPRTTTTSRSRTATTAREQ